MKLFDLTGKVAVVTGGNGGIGLGMATGLAEAGATIAVAAQNAAKAERAMAELKALGAKAAFFPVDVSKEANCRAMIAAVAETLGRLDILVNCAGMAIRKRPEVLKDEEWQRVLDVNLTGTFACCQAAYPHMKRAGGGKIINIGSMLSIFGAAPNAAYAASKGAVVQLTKSLAVAWAADNIQVNAILPGWIDTELTVAARQQIEGLNERVLARTPAGRWGRPEEFAGIAAFLASPASEFVTGTAIPVDGGFSVAV
ncbi:MAG TPA: glucose 1-dehydrogenase [Candidatus Binatia bacterium]|nr:glucose 1-dehydrogenase [Candidatus Binatia bacterium]